MEKLFQEINEISKAISEVEDEKYSEIFNSFQHILMTLATKVEEVIVDQEALEENVTYINDDVTDIRDELFEEVSVDDLQDEYVEINCNECGKPLFVEKASVENNTLIPCPFCHGKAK